MMPQQDPRGRFDLAVLWLACAVALAAGAYATFGALGSAIDAQQRRTGAVADTVLSNARLSAQMPQFERDEQTAQRRLRALALDADRPTTVARFLHAATRAAADARVTLDEVDERATAQAPSAAIGFDSIPLDVTLSGKYPDLLAAIRALARAPVSMKIEVAALERNTLPAGGAVPAPLTARLHIVLQRLADPGGAAPSIPSAFQEYATNARPL
jgi:hypothetical protein